jgi:hypothetical protein
MSLNTPDYANLAQEAYKRPGVDYSKDDAAIGGIKYQTRHDARSGAARKQ